MNKNQAALASQLEELGFCCIPGVLPSEKLEDLRRSVARDVKTHTDMPMPIGHVPGFLRVNQSMAPFLAHPRVLGLAQSLLGPHVRISMLTGSVNGPGIARGAFHADWPYNQQSAACIPAPYPDVLIHLVTFWMLTDFTEENGATIVVPRSHRKPNHPTEGGPVDPYSPHPAECRLLGSAGTIAVCDARLWHAVAPNRTRRERVAVIVRYAPWWLNLDPLRPGTVDRQDIVDSTGGSNAQVPSLPAAVFQRLPDEVKSLLRYSVDDPEPDG